MHKKLQHILSLTADLIQIGGFLGLTLATFIPFFMLVLGFFKKIPIYYVAVGFLVVLGVSVYVTRSLIRWIGNMSMSDAARQAYEELRGSLWGIAAERLSNASSPDGILDYLAKGLSRQLPVWGTYLPSTKLEKINEGELRRGSFKNGAKVFELSDEYKTTIADLKVRRRDLHAAIRHMRESTKKLE